MTEAASATALARFVARVGRLKSTPRTGWLDRGLPAEETESVADHSFRTALLAWLAAAAQPELDRDKVLKLALIHDLAEAVTGDLTPYDPAELSSALDDAARRSFLSRRHRRSAGRTAKKRAAERAAIGELVADLPVALADELRALWEEVETGASAEARFVKQVDKLETYLQSREYLAADDARPMDSFAAEVAEVITEPALVALRDAMGTARFDEELGVTEPERDAAPRSE